MKRLWVIINKKKIGKYIYEEHLNLKTNLIKLKKKDANIENGKLNIKCWRAMK